MTIKKETRNIVISDLRFLDEAEAIKKINGTILLTQRENKIVSQTGTEQKHSSEMELTLIKPDFILDSDNHTKEEIHEQIDEILGIIKNEK
jgi:hypothetical protein